MRRSQGISDYKINAGDGVLDIGKESQGRAPAPCLLPLYLMVSIVPDLAGSGQAGAEVVMGTYLPCSRLSAADLLPPKCLLT